MPNAHAPLCRHPDAATRLFPHACQAQPTGRLNDTGQTQCDDGSALVACMGANTGDGATHPRQDGRFGRDRAGMVKVGGGAAGFDFTKMCWNGAAEGSSSSSCTGTLVANTTATASSALATDWACTQDNHTNLIWSLQTSTGITWADATSSAIGRPIAAHNSTTRCGFATGWRVPTRRELLSIVHHGVRSPAIDGAYFPATENGPYWAKESYAPDTAIAWYVDFYDGASYVYSKDDTQLVRLVRSGQ